MLDIFSKDQTTMKKILFAVFCALTFSAATQAEECKWPCKPITIIIPNAPGSASDVAARRIGESIKSKLNVEYRLDYANGANGIVGTRKLLDSKPDGYTVMLSRAAIDVYNPVMKKNLPYDTLNDFTDIGVTFKFPMTIITSRTGKYQTYESIKHPLSNKGLNGGSSTHGGILLLKRFAKSNNIYIEAIPYNSPDASRNNLLGNHLDLMVETVFPAIKFHRQDQIKILAVATKERLHALPDVPTLAELGFPVEQWGFLSLRGPKGMPKDITDQLNDVLNHAMKERAYQAMLMSDGMFTPVNNRPGDLTKLIRKEIEFWDNVRQSENIARD